MNQPQNDVIYVDEYNNPVNPSNFQQGNAYLPSMTRNSEKADMIDKINPAEIVEIIRHRLLGENFVNGNWVKVPELANRALTDIGAWDIANLMLPVSSRNTAISKLKDADIRKRTVSICKTAQYMCIENWEEYGIKGTDQLWFVHEIIFSNTFITLKQNENGGIRDLIKGTSSEVKTFSTNQEQHKRGFGLFRRN